MTTEARLPGPGFAAKAAWVLIPLTSLVFVSGLHSWPLTLVLLGLALAFALAAAVDVLRAPAGRAEAQGRLGAIAVPIAAAAAYGIFVGISDLKAGLSARTLPGLTEMIGLPILFLLLPAAARDRRALVFALRAFVGLGFTATAAAWVLLAARLLFGLSWGVMPAAELLLEKRAIVDALGLPFLPRGLFSHPNTLGLVAFGVLAAGLALGPPEGRRRLPWIAGLALCGLTLVASLSVIAAFPAVLAAAGMTVFRRSRLWDRGLRAAAAAGLVFFLLAAAAGWNLSALDRIPIHSWSRVELWNRAIAATRESPLWGLGQAAALERLPYGLSAHNTPLETAIEHGLPALFASTLVLVALLAAWPARRDRLSRGLLHLLLGAVFLQAFEVLPLGGLWPQSSDVLALILPFLALARTDPAALDSPDGRP